MDLKTSSTLGYERRHNDLLAEEDEERFVERATGALGPQPPNFETIVELNKGKLLAGGVEVGPLTPRQVEQRRSEGALVVDVRTDLQFDDAHTPEAVCIPSL
jgi:hydroxyacylglutathione hydrolase